MQTKSRTRTALRMIAVAALAFAPAWTAQLRPVVFADLGDSDPAKVDPRMLHDGMRKVYEDQILWTRMVVLSVLDGVKGQEVYAHRLWENYEACEELMAPYYGDGAEKFGHLLEEHVVLTVKVLEDVKAGSVFASILPYWYENGDQLAAVMTALNPKYWPEMESRLVWRRYLDLTLETALARHKGDWGADVQAYDALHLHALRLADYMSLGMQNQFALPK
jgi:hypothetical protein